MSDSKAVSADFDAFDVWKLVSGRRQFEGQAPLASLKRLADLLTDTEGNVTYRVEFGTDELQVPSVQISVQAALPLVCQRSLERFEHDVSIEQTLGLITDEADEAALPPGYEPCLVPNDGKIRPMDLVEDELIMAVPLVPVAPGTEAMEQEWGASDDEVAAASPFAALSKLKGSTS